MQYIPLLPLIHTVPAFFDHFACQHSSSESQLIDGQYEQVECCERGSQTQLFDGFGKSLVFICAACVMLACMYMHITISLGQQSVVLCALAIRFVCDLARQSIFKLLHTSQMSHCGKFRCCEFTQCSHLIADLRASCDNVRLSGSTSCTTQCKHDLNLMVPQHLESTVTSLWHRLHGGFLGLQSDHAEVAEAFW